MIVTEEMVTAALDATLADIASIAAKMGGWSKDQRDRMRVGLEAALKDHDSDLEHMVSLYGQISVIVGRQGTEDYPITKTIQEMKDRLDAMLVRMDGPHPRWRPDDKSDRHPQTVGEWDYQQDGPPDALKRSLKRLNVAMDYDDPRAPNQYAMVLRTDLIRVIGDYTHKRAAFDYFLNPSKPPSVDRIKAISVDVYNLRNKNPKIDDPRWIEDIILPVIEQAFVLHTWAENLDAERWRAFMSSQRFHLMGTSGFVYDRVDRVDPDDKSNSLKDRIPRARPEGQMLIGMEFWNEHPAHNDPRYPDTFERLFLVAYVDEIIRRSKK